MSLQTTLGPVRAATRRPHWGRTRHGSVGTRLCLAMGLLRGWRERMRSRRQMRDLYELDDHILQDIGLTRAALGCGAETPFWP